MDVLFHDNRHDVHNFMLFYHMCYHKDFMIELQVYNQHIPEYEIILMFMGNYIVIVILVQLVHIPYNQQLDFFYFLYPFYFSIYYINSITYIIYVYNLLFFNL